MENPRILIIGAGPCGLGAAWRLRELGHENFRVYEQMDHAGGLDSSYTDENGFTWDIGGHVVHSHYAYFDAVLDAVMTDEFFTHERESWIWLYDRFIPYPFQNNIRHLPADALRECLEGLRILAQQKQKSPKHFADWIRLSFGEGIAKHFLFPYNRKVWACSLDKMDYRWVGDRVAGVNLARIEENIREKRDEVSWGPNTTFRFPQRGGTGEIWRRVARTIGSPITFKKNI